jgi:hypothetical protein
MRVCVNAFSIRYEVHGYNGKHSDFLKERKSILDQSKVKPYYAMA